MALETATYISDLNVSNPLSTDTVAQADDHLRLIKTVLKNTFPNLSGPVTSTANQLSYPLPVGVICLWSGAITSIPTGWVLCNGSNGTPDLRDRFVVGAGTTYSVGNTGGAASVQLTTGQLPAHSHSASSTFTGTALPAHGHSVTDPGHTHTLAGTSIGTGTTSTSTQPVSGSGTITTSTSFTGISIVNASAGTPSGTVTTTLSPTGNGDPIENRPPYYALAYIMKT